MGELKLSSPSSGYANNPDFVGNSKVFAPNFTPSPRISYKSSSIVPTLSRFALPTTFAMAGVQSMVDYAKSLYAEKLADLETKKTHNSSLLPDTVMPEAPDSGSDTYTPQGHVPKDVVPTSSTALEFMNKNLELNKDLVSALSVIANNLGSGGNFKGIEDSIKYVGDAINNQTEVNVSLVTVVSDALFAIVESLQNPSKTIEEIEYKNLELEILQNIADSIANSNHSSSIQFPDSIGVRMESLHPKQEQFIDKELYKQDIKIPMLEKYAENQDVEIDLVKKKHEAMTYELTESTFNNILSDDIPSMKPIEIKALRNAVQAKKLSDENTLEFDEDDFDTSFGFPDISEIFEFNKKSDRLTSIGG